MTLLSFAEASKAFGIPESTLRYWATTNKVEPQIEVRNGKEVAVLDEDELHTYINNKDANQSHSQFATGFDNPPTGLQLIIHYEERISQRDEYIKFLSKQIAELQYLLGETTATVQQLELRLKEAKSDKVSISDLRNEITQGLNEIIVAKELLYQRVDEVQKFEEERDQHIVNKMRAILEVYEKKKPKWKLW